MRHSLLHKPVLLSPVSLELRVVIMMPPVLLALRVVMIMPPVIVEPGEVMMALLDCLGFWPLVVVVLTHLPRLTATNRNSGFAG